MGQGKGNKVIIICVYIVLTDKLNYPQTMEELHAIVFDGVCHNLLKAYFVICYMYNMTSYPDASAQALLHWAN